MTTALTATPDEYVTIEEFLAIAIEEAGASSPAELTVADVAEVRAA